jgi:hypothetical protein
MGNLKGTSHEKLRLYPHEKSELYPQEAGKWEYPYINGTIPYINHH